MDSQYLQLVIKQQISTFVCYSLKVWMNFNAVESNFIFLYKVSCLFFFFPNFFSLASVEDIFWNICHMSLILGRGFYSLTTAFFRKTSKPNEEWTSQLFLIFMCRREMPSFTEVRPHFEINPVSNVMNFHLNIFDGIPVYVHLCNLEILPRLILLEFQ